MILRRLTKHVKDQNWFAVALDFSIVVVGILIAFQITNWSEARQDRAQERQIIERLYTDFEKLGRDVEESLEYIEPVVVALDEIERIFVGQRSEADVQRLKEFYETSLGFPPVAGQSDTYEQLVSSGGMKLLTNEKLRAELVKQASSTRTFINGDKAVREWARPYIMPIIRLGLLIDTMPLEDAFAEAGSEADFIVAFGMYRRTFEGRLAQHRAHRDSFASLTEMLAEEKSK